MQVKRCDNTTLKQTTTTKHQTIIKRTRRLVKNITIVTFKIKAYRIESTNRTCIHRKRIQITTVNITSSNESA